MKKSKKILSYKRRLKIIKTFLTSSCLRRASLRLAASYLYMASTKKIIPTVSIKEIVLKEAPLCMSIYSRRDGHLTHYELMVLAAITRHLSPRKILEIGTFDGVSTLHLALNSPEDCKIDTLDLLELDQSSHDIEDLKYIIDKEKRHKIYTSHPKQEKIQEHQGNSLTYPFDRFKAPQLIFIDGGHGYDTVKNDTEKSLTILANEGWIIWHDYSPECPGVFRYLNELSRSYSLEQIEDTSFALLKTKKKPH